MKYIKSYTIFERVSKSYDDSDFQLLSDILVSEVLDDMNIQYLSDNGEDEYLESESKYPYWCYGYNHLYGTIGQINICNLSKSQATEIADKLRNDIFPFINEKTGLNPQLIFIVWNNNYFESEDGKKAIINVYLDD